MATRPTLLEIGRHHVFNRTFLSEQTSGPFVQLVTLSEVFTATMASGYITSKRLSAVSQKHFQTDTNTATMRTSCIRSTTWGLASANEAVTTSLESIKEAVINCIALRPLSAAR